MNPELLKRAKEAALAEIEAAKQAALEKDAVIPGGDPAAAGGAPPMDPSTMGGAPPMDPSMVGGGAPPMDPSMAGGAPPADPSMMGGAPPSDPMLAGAGGGLNDMVNQAVQQALAANGVGGKGGPGGKGGKPDIAVELQKLSETVYKLGLICTALANNSGVELPAAALLGPPPEASDPALAQAATAMPAPPAGGAGDQGAPPDDGSAPFGQIPPLSGDPADAGAKQAVALDLAKLSGATTELERILGAYGLPDDSEFDKRAGAEAEDRDAAELNAFYDLIDIAPRPKRASAPDNVGSPYGSAEPFYEARTPLTMASRIRSRVKA